MFAPFLEDKSKFASTPTIKAQAMFEISTEPNLRNSPPMPVIKIDATTNKFFESLKSKLLHILSPETEMNPNKAIEMPPTTQVGMVSTTKTIGYINAIRILIMAARKIVLVEALRESATQPIDSP